MSYSHNFLPYLGYLVVSKPHDPAPSLLGPGLPCHWSMYHHSWPPHTLGVAGPYKGAQRIVLEPNSVFYFTYISSIPPDS